MRRITHALPWLLAACLLTVLLWTMQPPRVADAQAGVTNFDNVTVAQDLIVGDAGTFGGNLEVVGTLTAAAYVTDTGDVTLPGNVTISDSVTVGVDGTFTGDVLVGGTFAVASTSVLTGNTQIRGTTDLLGNIADSGGALTVADNVLIDGQADAVQLTVQGNATNTANLFVVENSAGTDQFTIGNTGNAGVTGDLAVTGAATADDLTVADFVNITAQAVITLTDNAILTPTGSIQPILAEAAIGIDGGTNIAHVADYLVLINIGAETVTFTETTGLISAGNIALGAGDASTLIWVNGGWIEKSRSNN